MIRNRNTLPARVLWVEGKDDSAVVQSLCRQHQFPRVFSVAEAEGDAGLASGITLQLRRRDLECIGFILDADRDAAARWASIRHALLAEGYPGVPERASPEGLVVTAPDLPRCGAWIMPDNISPGMLEDFVGALVPPGDYLWSHARDVIDGIPAEHRRFRPTERAKAHIHTWLSWQEGPGSPMGQAITKGDLDAHAPPALTLVAWLRRLFTDEPGTTP